MTMTHALTREPPDEMISCPVLYGPSGVLCEHCRETYLRRKAYRGRHRRSDGFKPPEAYYKPYGYPVGVGFNFTSDPPSAALWAARWPTSE
jgi:hypothetical protein